MTPLQQISTWLDFKRHMPQLPSSQKHALLKFMEEELNLNKVLKEFEMLASSFTFEDSLLPELEAKHGRSFTRWIVPPTTTCLECGNELTLCTDSVLKPTNSLLFELTGPRLAAKISFRCRKHDHQIRYR